jgi:hypothetical protein
MLLATWWWLDYLERKINLAFFLPIPFFRIRAKYVRYPFMLPFFGIRRLYLRFTHEDPNGQGVSRVEEESPRPSKHSPGR